MENIFGSGLKPPSLSSSQQVLGSGRPPVALVSSSSQSQSITPDAQLLASQAINSFRGRGVVIIQSDDREYQLKKQEAKREVDQQLRVIKQEVDKSSLTNHADFYSTLTKYFFGGLLACVALGIHDITPSPKRHNLLPIATFLGGVCLIFVIYSYIKSFCLKQKIDYSEANKN